MHLTLAIYLVLMLGDNTMEKVGLHNCIPTRKVIDGKKTSNSRSLCSTFNRDTNNWDCTGLDISERNRREMLANLIELRVLLMTATTCYRLGGRIYKQRRVLGLGHEEVLLLQSW